MTIKNGGAYIGLAYVEAYMKSQDECRRIAEEMIELAGDLRYDQSFRDLAVEVMHDVLINGLIDYEKLSKIQFGNWSET